MKTELRNKKVYVTDSQSGYFKPEIVTNFWLTDGDPTIIPDNMEVEKWNSCFLVKTEFKTISLHLKNEYPEFTEIVPMKKPGKNYTWNYGEWRKI